MIDAHAHLVTPDTTAYPPAPMSGEPLKPGALDNHLTVEALLANMDRLGVAKAVAVQRAHVYGFNNAYVLHAAARSPERLAAVACIDGSAAGAGDTVAALVAAGASGLRFTTAINDPNAVGWFAGPDAVDVWTVAERSGASLCLHLLRSNRDAGIAALAPLLARFPGVTMVLDHAGNPTSEAAGFGLDALDAITPFANLRIKISTINFEYLRKANDDLAAFTGAVVARFGAERVMWGSDIAQSAGTYDDFVANARRAVTGLPSAAQAAVLGDTAAGVYFANT